MPASKDMDAIEAVLKAEDWNAESVALCRAHEEEFRHFVLGRLNERISLWESHAADSVVLTEIESVVKAINLKMQEHYQEKANAWIESLSSHEREFVLNCFVDYDKQGTRPYVFDFDESVRRLKEKNNLYAQNICQGSKHLWMTFLLANPQEPPEVAGFKDSPFGRIIDQSFLENVNLSDAEYRRITLAQINRGLEQMRALKTELEELPPTKLYELYDFSELYQAGFVASLSEREREVYTPTCRDQSSWVTSCRPASFFGLRDSSRCVAKTLSFAGEVIPLYSIVDGMLSFGLANGAYRGDLLTSEEYRSEQNGNVLQVVFGIPITMGASTAVKSAAVATTERGVLSRIANFFRGPLTKKAFKRKVVRVGRCENCDLERIIIEVSDDAHMLPHKFSIKSAQDFAKPLEEEVMQILGSTLKRNQKMEAVEQILMRSDKSLSPFRNTWTSLSPSETAIAELIKKLPRSTFKQIGDVGNNGEIGYRVVHKGTTFRASICKFPMCRRGKEEINEVGRVLTIHPECGKGVHKLPPVTYFARRLLKQFNEAGSINSFVAVEELAQEILECK